MIFASLLINGTLFVVLLLLTILLPAGLVRFQVLNYLRGCLRFLSRPKTALLFVFLTSLLISAGISSGKKPVPRIHDEFSYLLAADTFANGRITNPPHPFWKHFESFHIIQQPTYASKYPPGQGLFLAAGQLLKGRPIAGSWLCTALACAAICWMLQACIPLRWALAGGMLSTFHPLILMWGQKYYGGSLAVLGGALLFGALYRLMKRPAAGTSLIMALGLLFLATSRPFEGFLTAIIAAIVLLAWMVKQSQFSMRRLSQLIIIPLALASICLVSALAFYNWKITGSATRFPYQVHEERYSPTPLFVWSPARNVKPSLPHIENFHQTWSFGIYEKQQSRKEYLHAIVLKSKIFFVEMFVFPLSILLTTLPWALRNHLTRLAVATVSIMLLIHVTCVTFFQAFYLAPVMPLIILILIQCARYWRVNFWENHSQGTVFLCGFSLLYFGLSLSLIYEYLSDPTTPTRYQLALSRSRVIEQLKQRPQKDLIFVKYPEDHDFHFDWVYNRADIDGAEVIWAHDLGELDNQRLIQYYPDRQIWRLSLSDQKIRLSPYRKKNEPKTQRNQESPPP